MPNLRGASPVGLGVRSRSYTARSNNKDEPSRHGRGRSGIPSTNRENSNLGRRCSRTAREKMGLVSKIHSQVTSVWSGKQDTSPAGCSKSEGNSVPQFSLCCRRAQLWLRGQRVPQG